MNYLIEFRKRLINCLFLFALLSIFLLYFSNQIYTWIALPLLHQLPKGQALIAINITAPFFVPFDLALAAALFLSMPFFLYQLWLFIAPALYLHERQLVWPLLCSSVLLFYMGICFAYFMILPLLFHFLTHTAPQGVNISPDIAEYLNFVLKFFFFFGMIFEIPVIIILLIGSGIVSIEKLINLRPYAIVSAFIIGMFFAPPDVFSQTVLAIPLWLLFEIGIFLARIFVRKQHGNQRRNDKTRD